MHERVIEREYLKQEGAEGSAVGAGQLQSVMPGGVLSLGIYSHDTIGIAFHQVQVLLQGRHLCISTQ